MTFRELRGKVYFGIGYISPFIGIIALAFFWHWLVD